MKITFLCPSGQPPVGGVTTLYDFANGLARRGHEIHLAHLEGWGRRIDSIDELEGVRFEPAIQHHFAGEHPDTLPNTDIVFGTGVAARFGLPVLLVQGIDMLYPHLERQGFRTPCLKVCVASWLVDAGARYGVTADQMQVVPNGLDHQRFRLTRPIEDRPLQVAMLYSSHAAKGWNVGLEALDEVHRLVPSVRVRVFGTAVPPGPLPGWLEFTHAPPHRELVDEIYNGSRVFLQSSDYEGFGLTAIEAMACGAALVTTDNGGSDDYALHGETALVVPPREAGSLASAATSLLLDDGERIRLAVAGVQHVERFDWDRSAALLEGHLLRYLADPAAYLTAPGSELPPRGADAR